VSEVTRGFAELLRLLRHEPSPTMTAEQVRAKYGISDAAWDAVPPRPTLPTAPRGRLVCWADVVRKQKTGTWD
jgi:hypothetical protein